MKKKAVSLLLVLAMCLSILPIPAHAASSDFTIENGVLTKYNGTGGNVKIPAGVTAIGKNAFSDCTSLTNVTIPNSVTEIGDYAFYWCTSLTNVTIPNSVTEIGNGAFYDCTSLTSITIPNSVTEIGGGAFSDCTSLTSITIPNSVTEIGGRAFSGCTGLTRVSIPSDTKLGIEVFGDTPWLKNLLRSSGDFVVLNNVLLAYQGNSGQVTIPENITCIDKGAFLGNSYLREILIPDRVTEIGSTAFAGCENLKDVTLPNGITTLADIFVNCKSLTSVTIPSSVEVMSETFRGCDRLTSVVFADGIESIYTMISPFGECPSLKSITIPASLTDIIGMDLPRNLAEKVTIYGAAGSAAEAYAKENNLLFVSEQSAQSKPTKLPGTGFFDVSDKSYCAGAVKWAAANGITTGTSSGLFQPDVTCNNAQILTFLWRAHGSPVASEPSDIMGLNRDSYYYLAALWAADKGMISVWVPDPSGDPNSVVSWSYVAKQDCTRAMTVMYLWQAAGSPAAKSAVKFSDVPANASYAAAVAWAVEKGITKGTSATTFSPNQTCTRGQVVTFLYRAFA